MLLTPRRFDAIFVLPYMASLVAKKKGNKLYYYVVESARVDGKPRIVHQAYLGTAGDPGKLTEAVRRTIRARSPEVPVQFTTLEASLSESVAPPRFRTVLSGIFAGLAVLLSLIHISEPTRR